MSERTGISRSRGWAKPGTALSLALLTVAVLAVTLPFIFKAFRMDDTFFVWLGQLKVDDPLALGLPDHGYEGNLFSLYLDTHPPLFASFVAALVWLFGGPSEPGLHLGFILFPLLAAFSMYFLARRFTDSPLAAALLLVVAPGFMVMSQALMTDVPTVALWLATVAAYVEAVDRDDGRLLWLAGAAASLAVLTTYQSFSLLPLLFLYALLRRRVTLRNMAPLAAALAVFGGVIILYQVQTGGPPQFSYSIGLNMSATFIANKVLAAVSVIGGAIVFPLFLVMGLLKGRRDYFYFAALMAALLAAFLLRVPSGRYSLAAALLQAVFYAGGALAVYRFLSAGADSALTSERGPVDLDNIFLVLWLLGVLAYTIILLPYASTRYLLTLFPPVILMFTRHARTVFTDGRKWTGFAAAAIACTAALALAVSVADYRLAGVYRDFAATYPRELTQTGGRIWFAGEFGLRYYLEENGGTYLTADNDAPLPGDYVILSHENIAHFLPPGLSERLELVQSVDYPDAWPFRVSDRSSQAGFYSQFHGYLPWSLGDGPIETIDIYMVR